MRQHRTEKDIFPATRNCAEGELRIVRQKELIARLKRNGRPTDQAEAVLKGFEVSLLQLRNHLDLMQELMKPDWSGD